MFVNPRSELIREPGLLIPGKKPIGPVRVDFTHPFMRGCAAYCPLIGYEWINLVTGKQLVPSGSNTSYIKPVQNHGNTCLSIPLVSTSSSSPYMQGDVTNSSSYTVIIKGYQTSAIYNYPTFCGTVASSPNRGFELVSNNSREFWWANEESFAINKTGDIFTIGDPSIMGLVYNESSGTKVYFGSVETDSDANTGAAASASNFQLGANGGSSTTLRAGVDIEYFYLFDRALSVEEYRSVIADPYAPLVPA